MPVGGKREGAGRKPGSLNRRSKEAAEQAKREGITPLDYMLKIMRDESSDLDRRDDMAKACAPYIHPRLQSTTVKGTGDEGEIVTKLKIEYVNAENPAPR